MTAPLVDVVYEEIVSDPATRIPALVANCGLPWDSRCLLPEESNASVNTLSVDQVRRPIHRDSIDRYRRYDRFLGDLREAVMAIGEP